MCKVQGYGVLATVVFLCILTISPSFGTIIVDGTPAERTQIESWLTSSLGTAVTIDAQGHIQVAAGGNAGATRLREMAEDAGTTATIEVVDDVAGVSVGAWDADSTGKTTGRQKVDIKDLENFKNVRNSYGLTPDTKLMHEITEVYLGVKKKAKCWGYHRCHDSAVIAEQELLQAHNTDWVGPRYDHNPKTGYWYTKIKRPPGSIPPYVVVRVKAYVKGEKIEWFKEKVPCKSYQNAEKPGKLIAIPDPDPQVHIYDYDFDGEHTRLAKIDTLNSSPTGAAFDASGVIYVTEDLPGTDKIRFFDMAGNQLDSIVAPELVDPQGIDVDPISGDIYVAVVGQVLRFTSTKYFVGAYDVSDPSFSPTDVSIWRSEISSADFERTDTTHAIFVSDRSSNQIYRFDTEEDLNHETYTSAFGNEWLSAPEGVSVDSWDAVWVASTGNHRIFRFDTEGRIIRQNGPDYSQDHFVEDAARTFYDMEMVDFDGLYVVDETPGHGELLLYDYDGTLLETYGTDTLQCPASLAIYFGIDADNLLALNCEGRVGDANGLGGDEPTIGDISVMIDAKFITGTCDGIIACLAEADVNQSGGTDPTCDDITIGDISILIDYLFISGPSLGLNDCL